MAAYLTAPIPIFLTLVVNLMLKNLRVKFGIMLLTYSFSENVFYIGRFG